MKAIEITTGFLVGGDCGGQLQTKNASGKPDTLHSAKRRVTTASVPGLRGIDGRGRSARRARKWRREALKQKGGRNCPIDIQEKIEAATFSLWRALELRDHILAQAAERTILPNPRARRHRSLPRSNKDYDRAMEHWQKISDELGLNKPVDLATRYMMQGKGG